jgi:PAS domain S-box-containing protein
MSVLLDWREDFLMRIRKIRIRNSIAIPIVLILLSIAMVILVAGYYINKSVFYSVFEERESNKARNIHLTIESIVSTEVKRISSIAKILKNDTDIVYGLFHYISTHGDAKPLKSAMDQLYPKMNLSVFAMADSRGTILYRAGKGKEMPKGKLRAMPEFRRALKGKQVIIANQGPGGWGIWSIVPVYGFGKGKPSGMIFLGSWIDNTFARKIAQETGSQVFIGTSKRVIAGSYENDLQNAFDPSLAEISLAGQKPIFQVDRSNYRSYTYVPLKIVDNTFCLVIETDISVIQDLLAGNRTKMVGWGIVLLLSIALAGFGFTFILIRPLNCLYGKVLQVIREYSGTDVDAISGGNEITTLVRANDVMLETIKNNLSERTRAEEELRETSHTLEALIEASPLAVIVSDASGTVRVWNVAAARLFGWREDEAVGFQNPLLSAEGNPELCAICKLVLRGERFSNWEVRGHRADGSEIILSFSGAPLSDKGGIVVAMMAIIADISDSKKAEMALKKSEEQLRQSQKMEAVGKLAGGVAHDFNNVLSVITGYTELLLLRLKRKNPVRRELEQIHKAGERAAALTRQLLAFSRRQVLQPKLLQLPEVVENIGKMIRRLIGENIEFVTEASPDPWTVRADPSQVEQILMNLVVNARDAMPQGGKLVVSTANYFLESPFVERELTIPPGRYATLKIADNGCGMDEAVLSRIFEPFYTTKEKGKGTGLGLATVYGIVKQSNGFIRVESAPGAGTSVTVYLPVAVKEGDGAKEEPQSAKNQRLTGKETILLVEDEEVVRELATESLQRYGYTVLAASNGDKALSICEEYKERIDLLITDLVMPGMNGIELARRFLDSRSEIPVLFMSGYSEDAMEHLKDMTQRQSFLPKPITPTTLSRKVREMFSLLSTV